MASGSLHGGDGLGRVGVGGGGVSSIGLPSLRLSCLSLPVSLGRWFCYSCSQLGASRSPESTQSQAKGGVGGGLGWGQRSTGVNRGLSIPRSSRTVLILCCCCSIIKLCPTLETPWTVARQAPLSMGFSRQECWSGLPCPPPGDLPDPGIEAESPVSPALEVDSLSLGSLGGP